MNKARGPGRPPFGEVALVVTTVRVPPPLLSIYEVEARRRGVSLGALIREVLERGWAAEA